MLRNPSRYSKHLSKLPSLKSSIKLFSKDLTMDLDSNASFYILESVNLEGLCLLLLMLENLLIKVKFFGTVSLSTLFQKMVIKSSTI